MAAVLAHFLPERYLRQPPSLKDRMQENDADHSMTTATVESNSRIRLNGTLRNGDIHEDDTRAEDEDAYLAQQGSEDSADDEDDYRGSEATKRKQVAAPRLRKRKMHPHQPAPNANKRIKRIVTDSDDSEDGSSATGETSSEDDNEEKEAPWEADSATAEEMEDPTGRDGNHCIFCGGDENEDPSEDFEEMLACASCGDKSHGQCAREASALDTDDNAALWHCRNCTHHGIEAPIPQTTDRQRRASAPKIARDLLPVQRGASRPGSHSVFNTLILEGDPMDGSRSLRKRKASDEAEDNTHPDHRKRPKRATSELSRTQPIALDGASSPKPRNPPRNVAMETKTLVSPSIRQSRTRGARRSDRPLVTVVEPRSDDNLTLAFHLGSEKLRDLDNEKRKRKRRERERARRANLGRVELPVAEVSHYPALQSSSLALQPLMSDREGDDIKLKPYGGILSEVEAENSKTFPQAVDRKKFEDARLKAEEDWRKKIEAAREAEAARSSQKASGQASKIKCINFNGYEIDTWHAAPYPEEYSRNRVLYICGFCLKYMNSDFVAWRHKLKCPAKHPPGDEIYRDEQFSFFEVDGRKNPVYCQNLCLLAKLFLGSKTLYYDVEPFLFYIMTENDEYGCHFVGYFSKEKRPSSLNNVSCILVLPIHQRRGFGNLLIEFSYLLTRMEGKTGSPEKPLSDMGLVTYRSYWRLVMCYQLLEQRDTISISTLSERTGMTADDIVCALEGLRALVRDPVTKTYALRLDYDYFQQYINDYEAKGYVRLNHGALTWVPYVMGRDNMHYENAAPLYTVAQRDEENEDVRPEEGIQNTALATGDAASKAASSDFLNTPMLASPHLSPAINSQDEGSKEGDFSDQRHTPTTMTPTTPFLPDQAENDDSPIPASRYEVFPPLPGTATRRRQRPSTGRSGRRTTVRRNLSFGDTPNPGAYSQPTTVRRTRSKLAETVGMQDGDNLEDGVNARGSPRKRERVSQSRVIRDNEDEVAADVGMVDE